MHSTNFSNITTVQCNKSKHVYLSQGYQQNSFLYTSNNTIINVYDVSIAMENGTLLSPTDTVL